MVESVALWCDALYGRAPVEDALSALVKAANAEAGALFRSHHAQATPTRIALVDRLARGSSRPLKSSFAAGTFGSDFRRAKPGSLWLASSVETSDEEGPDPALADWQEVRGTREFAALMLANSPSGFDHLELHFRAIPTQTEELALQTLAPTIARTWARRQPGLITGLIAAARASGTAGPDRTAEPLLGLTNPARLSRAEFRVCLLLSRGLSAKGVADELDLSEATVRSHLRSIYAKTGASSQAQLVYRLLGPRALASEARGLHVA
jgi:DNA-binding CsgD family transcriptional regulator